MKKEINKYIVKKHTLLALANENNIVLNPDIMIDIFGNAIKRIYSDELSPESDLYFKVSIINNDDYSLQIFQKWLIVKEKFNENTEITLDEIPVNKKKYKVGDNYSKVIDIQKTMNRVNIFKIKNFFIKKIIEYNNNKVYDVMIPYEHKIITGEVELINNNFARIKVLNNYYGYYQKSNQIKNEHLVEGKKYEFYVEEVVKNSNRLFPLILSRTNSDFLKELMREEIPEIEEKIVEIIKIYRMAGVRSKIAVISHDPMIEPIGSCVGNGGTRINSVSRRINNERIDLFRWSENFESMLENCFYPIKVLKIFFEKDFDRFTILVHDEDVFKTIGKYGVNCILASKIVDKKVNVIGLTKAIELEYDLKSLYEEEAEKEVAPKPKQKIKDKKETKKKINEADIYNKKNVLIDKKESESDLDKAISLGNKKKSIKVKSKYNSKKNVSKDDKVDILKKISTTSDNVFNENKEKEDEDSIFDENNAFDNDFFGDDDF